MVAACGLQGTGSIVVVHGLVALWHLGASWIILCLLHWQADSYPLCHQGSPLIVVVISIYLIISDVAHPFMCFQPFCTSSLEKYLFRSPVQFFDSVVCFFDIELYELFVYFGD